MTPSTARSAATVAGLAGLGGLLTVAAPLPAVIADLGDLPAAWAGGGPDALVLAVAGAACWAALAWLVLAVTVVVVGARPGRCARIARGVAGLAVPPGMRRLLAVGIGLAVVTSTATGPALAAGPSPRRPAVAVTAAGVGTAGMTAAGIDLDWPVTQARPAAPAVAEPLVVVRTGDSLWTIARRQLPAGAPDSAIAATWPRWYAANRHLIGPDPDLLVPGQRLTPPAPSTPSPGDPS